MRQSSLAHHRRRVASRKLKIERAPHATIDAWSRPLALRCRLIMGGREEGSGRSASRFEELSQITSAAISTRSGNNPIAGMGLCDTTTNNWQVAAQRYHQMMCGSLLQGKSRSTILMAVALLIGGCADETGASSEDPPQQKASNGTRTTAYPKLQGWKGFRARDLPSDWSDTIAGACVSGMFDAIQSMRDNGAIVDTTGETYVVRNASCIPVALDEGVWGCTFEHAITSRFIPRPPIEGLDFPDDPESAQVIPEGRWKKNFQLLYYGREAEADEPYDYHWRVIDTCERFVFQIGDMEIDPREMMKEDIETYLNRRLRERRQ